MSNRDNINAFDDIQSLCSEFRRRLRRGERKQIEDYLDGVDESSKEMLFQNLLHIEIEFQRRQKQDPSSDDYNARFPQFGRLIRQAFFESTMMSQEMLEDTPLDEPAVLLGMPAARRLGEYELLRELGRGGFGVVYEARHLHRNELVALKTLPSGIDGQPQQLRDAERLHKFRREFRSLSEVNHPNLAGMQTLEVDGNQWFFTMDLVDGVDFLEYVRSDNRLDEDRLRHALTQLVQGILALHKAGVVHRDLKPSNVLVSADGHVVILDFGLVAELQQRTDQTVSMPSMNFAGTPRYAAPEQSGGTVTSASDWYALGVMLYEALTNEVPFKGSAVELVVQKQTKNAPVLTGSEELPQDLTELVDQLLQRETEHRPDAAAICKAVGIVVESPSHDSTDSSLITASNQSEVLLVGRESQLTKLETVRQELLEKGEPVVVFISGRSGEGKTSLAETFLTPLRRDDEMLVLSGRCYDRESVPFKAIDCLIDALVAYLRSRNTDEVLRLLPDDIHMLAQLFPVLRRVGAIADRPALNIAGIDSRQIRYRAFAALRELLAAISQSTPVVLFIDDLQWGDGDSAGALFELLLPPNPPAVMLMGSYRTDEADESPFLGDWRERERETDQKVRELTVEVAPLTEDQCISLFAARLGGDSDDLREQARDLYQGTQGNPYFLEQLIEGFDAETGQFQAVPLSEIIDRKLQRLPSEATALLEVIAVAGQAVKLDEAASVSDQSSQAFATITHMCSERLLRLIGSSEQQLVDTYHDKIRESVLDSLPESKRRDLHIRFGELLEDTESVSAAEILEYLKQDAAASETELVTTDRIFDLAYHFHSAGDSRGFVYQLMAGEQSFCAYASEDAVEFLKRAEASLPTDAPATVLYRLWERLGSSHARLRELDEALRVYEQAIECAPSHLARAWAHLGVARCYQAQGKYTNATASYDQVLRETGTRRPSSLGVVVGTPLLAARIFFVPYRWQQAGNKDKMAVARLDMEVYGDLGYYIFDQDLPLSQYGWALFRQACSAIRTGQPTYISRGLSMFAGHIAANGLPGVGRRLSTRLSTFAENLRDAETQGSFLYTAAITCANSRQVSRGDALFREALPLLRKCGAHSRASVTAHLHRHLHAVIGSSSMERETAEEVVRLAEGVGDIRGQFWGHYDIASALCRAGDIEAAKSQIEQARACLGNNRMHLSEAIFLATHGYVLLQASEYEAARTVLEESWQITKRRKIIMEYVVRALPWFIESIVGPDWLNSPQNSQTKGLKQLCRVAWLMYWFYPNIQSPIQRVRGRAFCVLGKRNKAIRCFKRAVNCATSLGADYDRARSMLDLAAVQEEERGELRREAIQLLKQQESVIPYAERWLLGDQYDEQCVAPPPVSQRIEEQ